MSATTSDMPRATRFRQVPGRPFTHVHLIGTREDTPIMPDSFKIRIPGQRRAEPQHQPWCVNHIAGLNSDDPCEGDTLDAGGAWVGLNANPARDGGPRIDWGSSDLLNGASVDDAERFATAILIQVARVRGLKVPAHALAAVTS